MQVRWKVSFAFLIFLLMRADANFKDMSDGGPYIAGEEYRLSYTGMIGTIADDHVRVTDVNRGSILDGKVLPGDRLIRMQGIPLSRNLPVTVRRQMTRLWRENDGRLALTFARSQNGEDATFTVPLHLPAPPGTIQHFGPIGIHGAMHGDYIEVTEILTGSPADGSVEVGDRITALEGQPLHGDLLHLIAYHIEQAEANEEGTLTLGVNRSSKDRREQMVEVTISLPVLGARSKTSPRDCPKTDRLISHAADSIVTSGETGRLDIGLLGLLATGEETYIDYVGTYLQEAEFANPDIELSLSVPMVSWPWSYRLITLCEYYLLTGDDTVLPAIERYARTIALGQDVAGLWNHRMADPEANRGQYNGRLYGYGAINQTSAVLWIGLILAEKCGVDDPAVLSAIQNTRALYASWAGKGALPYGNHAAMEEILTNNGTSGSVAVGFALLGDKDAARFYARLSAASHGAIFTGHTGPFFNYFWSSLGANVLGPEVWAAYEREIGWLRTLTRVWDGRFQYMEQRGNIFSYSDLSSTGANLLNLTAGRRALHITGKSMPEELWLAGEVALVATEHPEPDPEQPTKQLLEYLGHFLPPVRLAAASALGAQRADVAPKLLDLLQGDDRDLRIGVLHALREMQVDDAADALLKIINDDSEDIWVREVAIRTLIDIDPDVSHVDTLLAFLVMDKPTDPFRNLDLALGRALRTILSSDPFAHDLDWDLFYAGVLQLLDHPHMWARNAGMNLLENMPSEDFYRVADMVIHVIHDEDLRYTAYHSDNHRQAGLDLLNRLQVEEVLALTVETMSQPTGRPGLRRRNRLALLRSFGREAESIIPLIEEELGDDASSFIESIQQSEIRREMIPLADMIP